MENDINIKIVDEKMIERANYSKENGRRFGRVLVDIDLVERDLPILALLMNEFDFIVRVECVYATRAFELTAICPKFKPVNGGIVVPTYIVEVTYNGDSDEYTFRFIHEDEVDYVAKTFNG